MRKVRAPAPTIATSINKHPVHKPNVSSIFHCCFEHSRWQEQGERKKPRITITTAWLATLKNLYDKHFSAYCLHKKNPVHRIPAPVWKLVYADFVQECKEECIVLNIEYDASNYPAERNLQDNLRDCRLDLKCSCFCLCVNFGGAERSN
jgi:hypothetical protein